MAVTDREEVAVAEAHNVWVGQVRVLIHFKRVMRGDAALGRERELSDDVGQLLSVYRPAIFLRRRVRTVLDQRHFVFGVG